VVENPNRGCNGQLAVFAHRRLRAPYRRRGLCAIPLVSVTSSLPCDDRAGGILLRSGLDCGSLGAALRVATGREAESQHRRCRFSKPYP
jgi:hypothetical protein